jgi:hypothetical protein
MKDLNKRCNERKYMRVLTNKEFTEIKSSKDNFDVLEMRTHNFLRSHVVIDGRKYEVLSGFPTDKNESISDKLRYLITGTNN